MHHELWIRILLVILKNYTCMRIAKERVCFKILRHLWPWDTKKSLPLFDFHCCTLTCSECNPCSILSSKSNWLAVPACFACRMPYSEFQQRYSILLKNRDERGAAGAGLTYQEAEQKENVCDPLDLLFRQQLDLPVSPRRTPTPRKKLRRRTGAVF